MLEDNKTALKQGIGSRVRTLRKSRGWKQQTLAEMIGDRSHSTISEIELGRRMPSPRTLHALAAVFQVSVGSLLGDTAPAQGESAATQALKASLRTELAEIRSCLDRASKLLQLCLLLLCQ